MYRLIFLACVFATGYAIVGNQCKTEDDCDAGECCQILSQFMIMSKRQLESLVLNAASDTGTCQLYKLEGAACDSFEKLNGYCGCGPDLQCYSRQEPIPDASARMMVAPDPGYQWVFSCEKPENIPVASP